MDECFDTPQQMRAANQQPKTTAPEGFLWGGATASFQYEGGWDEGGRKPSTHDYETDGTKDVPRRNTWRLPDGTVGEGRSHFFVPETLPDGAVPYIADDRYYPSHRAVDFYHHWEEDIDLMAGMGFNVFRFSICWSRIFPLGTEEKPNEEGLAFYERVIDRLHERGIEPLITIYHDEMPALPKHWRMTVGLAAPQWMLMCAIAKHSLSGSARSASGILRSMR